MKAEFEMYKGRENKNRYPDDMEKDVKGLLEQYWACNIEKFD